MQQQQNKTVIASSRTSAPSPPRTSISCMSCSWPIYLSEYMISQISCMPRLNWMVSCMIFTLVSSIWRHCESPLELWCALHHAMEVWALFDLNCTLCSTGCFFSQPIVFFSHTKLVPATSQPAVIFSHDKPAPATSRKPATLASCFLHNNKKT